MRATMAEQIAINAKLQEVCKQVEGMAIYAEGWDDKRVAAEAAPRLTENHVAYVRKQMGFGKLKIVPVNQGKDIEELQAFVVQLVQGFERLTKQHTELSKRVAELERWVGDTIKINEERREGNVTSIEARRL